MRVLISEVAGQGRWSQFNLKLGWVPHFFGAAPQALNTVSLCELDGAGNVGAVYNQAAVYKKGSRNWAFEIPNSADLKFPGKTKRPILLISQHQSGNYPFLLLMPNDIDYEDVVKLLRDNRQTFGRELSRCITPRTQFITSFPHLPL